MHKTILPAIHYWGTPVVLISTLNEDGTVNVAPMSSAWWLGWSCMLGLDASSHTVRNLQRTGECVLNLTSQQNAEAVNRLAFTTGSASVPLHKKRLGYRSVTDKLGHGQLQIVASSQIQPPRLLECPVHLEAVVERIRPFARRDPKLAIAACSVEVRIVATHVDDSLLTDDDHVDPQRWRSLLMNFRQLCVASEPLPTSRLARGDDAAYAPWKQGALMNFVGKVLKAAGNAQVGVREVDDEDT